MTLLRAFLCDHRKLALWLVALALLMKAVVPAGFMLGTQGQVLAVQICGDASGGHYTRQIFIPRDPAAGDRSTDHAKADGACPYLTLSFASLAQTVPALLGLLLAFVLSTGIAAIVPALPRRADRLRPPLRGPPSLA